MFEGKICSYFRAFTTNVTLDNSTAYLASWMQVLRDEPTMLVQAAGQAQKAADYIQNLPPDVEA